jgi:hypothetical protein
MDPGEIGWQDVEGTGSGQGPAADCWKHGNEPSNHIKVENVLTSSAHCYSLKKNYTPWNYTIIWWEGSLHPRFV